MPSSTPARRRRPGRRWLVLVVVGGILSALTAPGQTAGLSVFTDALLVHLETSRTALSVSYLIGTLVGAACQPFIGRAVDRFGPPRCLVAIVAAFAAVLAAASWAADLSAITAAYVGLRMLGQGALGLATTTAVARAVTHRRGLALGVVGAMGSAGISLAPIGVERVVTEAGFAAAWRVEALLVLLVGLPLVWVLARQLRSPEQASTLAPAGAAPTEPRPPRPVWTLRQAVATGPFWVIAACLAAAGMLTTALAFHQISLLGERGLPPLEAAANFLPQTATALLSTLVTGALVDRVSPRWFVLVSMLSLSAALASLGLIQPGAAAIGYGLVLGTAGGTLRGMEAATYASYYGVQHIGAIRGVATSIGLASTALGPVVLSLGRDLAGSFATPALVLAVIPLAVAAAGLTMRAPRHPEDPAP